MTVVGNRIVCDADGCEDGGMVLTRSSEGRSIDVAVRLVFSTQGWTSDESHDPPLDHCPVHATLVG